MRYDLHALLRRGAPVLGAFLQLGSEAVLEIMAYAGFQFFIIDNEHASGGGKENGNLIRACEAAGLPALIRVPDVNEAAFKKALDAGASGLMIPNIHTLEDAERAVSYAKFAPEGVRGVCPFVRAARYNNMTVPQYCQQSNEQTFMILSVEGRDAVRDMESLLRIPGVDAISVGSFDLSVSMGVPGQTGHPDIRAAQRKMVDLSRALGKAVVGFATDLESASMWAEMQPDILLYRGDADFITAAFTQELKRVRAVIDR